LLQCSKNSERHAQRQTENKVFLVRLCRAASYFRENKNSQNIRERKYVFGKDCKIIAVNALLTMAAWLEKQSCMWKMEAEKQKTF